MNSKKTSFWLSPKGLAAIGLIGAVTYFLLMEHRQHVWQFLPFLIFLACPFMHLFMHKGHGGHSAHGNNKKPGNSNESDPDEDAYQRGVEEGLKQAKHQNPNE